MGLFDRKWLAPARAGPSTHSTAVTHTAFTRLSSGFRVRDPPDERPRMELSEALVARLHAYREQAQLALGPAARSPEIDSVITRMRALAGEATAGRLAVLPSAELAELDAQIEEAAGNCRNADADSIAHALDAAVAVGKDVGFSAGGASPAGASRIHRLVAALARARALQGNVAAAASAASAITVAEEMSALYRAQNLLEDRVSKLTEALPPSPARRLLN